MASKYPSLPRNDAWPGQNLHFDLPDSLSHILGSGMDHRGFLAMDAIKFALTQLSMLDLLRDADLAGSEEDSADETVQSKELSQMSPNLDQSPRLVSHVCRP